MIGVAKNTVYNWKDKQSSLKIKYAHLKPIIQEICEDTVKYGKRRLSKELKRRGFNIGVKLANKLNKLWGNVYTKKVKSPKVGLIQEIIIQLGIMANLLRSVDLTRIKPFQVTMSDASEIVFNHGNSKACLTSREDFNSKLITGYTLSDTPTAKAAVETLIQEEKLRKRLNLDFYNVIAHQDQGSVYTSYEYTGWLLSRDALLSYSKRASPGDNAAKESFFGRFKNEFQDVFLECESFDELKKEVENAIKYYNEKRLHSSLGYVPPKEYLESLGYKV